MTEAEAALNYSVLYCSTFDFPYRHDISYFSNVYGLILMVATCFRVNCRASVIVY